MLLRLQRVLGETYPDSGRVVPRIWEERFWEWSDEGGGVEESDWEKYFGFYPYLALDTICGRWYGVPFRFACTGVGDSPARLIKWWGVADLQLSALKILFICACIAFFALLNRQRVGISAPPRQTDADAWHRPSRKNYIFRSISPAFSFSTLTPISPPNSTSPT